MNPQRLSTGTTIQGSPANLGSSPSGARLNGELRLCTSRRQCSFAKQSRTLAQRANSVLSTDCFDSEPTYLLRFALATCWTSVEIAATDRNCQIQNSTGRLADRSSAPEHPANQLILAVEMCFRVQSSNCALSGEKGRVC